MASATDVVVGVTRLTNMFFGEKFFIEVVGERKSEVSLILMSLIT